MTKKEETRYFHGSIKTMLNITYLKKTCIAMPAQWEGKLEDGRMIYIRYRHGYLSIRVSPAPSDDIMDAVGAKEIYGELIGNGADGDMEECELISITKHILQYPSFIEDQWGAK